MEGGRVRERDGGRESERGRERERERERERDSPRFHLRYIALRCMLGVYP